jgi:hypothetical protein
MLWACAGVWSKAISAAQLNVRRVSVRHGNDARELDARSRRPVTGPDITIKILQRIQSLGDQAPRPREHGCGKCR